MGIIEEKTGTDKPSKELLQEWMDGVSYALHHIPAGHQVDLAREIIQQHYPHMPDLTFEADRGDIMIWASSQEAAMLSAVLDEITVELGSRGMTEMQSKRMMKLAWGKLNEGARQSFLNWAQRGEQ